MRQGFTESVIDEATLAWLESLSWTVKHSLAIAPSELASERNNYGQVLFTQRLRETLARLSPTLPAEAIENAFRKLTRPEGPTLESRTHAINMLAVDGVLVKDRHSEERRGSGPDTTARHLSSSR
jgi:type I restriction enzyme R subunit